VFSVEVSYGLREYLSCLRDFVPAVRTARWRGVEPHQLEPGEVRLPWRQRPMLFLAGLAMYFYKTRKVGTCTFTVGEDGLERKSRLGTLSVDWKDVRCVYKLRRAYLVALEKGATPIPYRVLSGEQRNEFESLLERNGVKTARFGS